MVVAQACLTKKPNRLSTQEEILKSWLVADQLRAECLNLASRLQLPNWCLAAGFVRNLAWDRFHNYKENTHLNDIDLIYFDSSDISEASDVAFEEKLKSNFNLPWSVKNQARMHIRNDDPPYTSTADAMSYWVEIETAIGVTKDQSGNVQFLSPFGLQHLFSGTITLNAKRPKPAAFAQRIKTKGWLKHWPKLTVVSAV